MTKPTVTSQISLGNIIQIGVLLVGLVAGWFTMRNEVDAALNASGNNSAEISEMSERIRALETRSARDSEQLNTLRRDIGELKTGQREINGLLRQLLQRGAIDPR